MKSMRNVALGSSILLLVEHGQAGHTKVPTVDVTNIEDTTPDAKPRYLKNPTSFTLIDTDDGSIESFADDQV